MKANVAMLDRFTIGGIDTEVDGDRGDALVGASESVGLCFDLEADLIKVHKLTALTVQELCIFYREGRQSVRKANGGSVSATLNELKGFVRQLG